MGIYIKGMEMPKSCGFCPLRHEARDGDECYLGASLTEYQKRPDDCLLAPVPPHVRLGDLDALIEKVIAKYLEHERKGELVFAAAEIKQDIVDLISNAPTIIPADVPENNVGNIPAEEGET